MHAVSIAHGIGASLVVAATFCLSGLVVLPRRWENSVSRATCAFIGAALYVIVCWVAIGAGVIPLTSVLAGFVAGTLLLVVLRFRRVGAAVRPVLSWSGMGWVLLFSLFYTLAYVLAMPAVAGASLPPLSTGTLDLLTHARYARHLIELGSPQLVDATFDYGRHPAVAYLLGGFSIPFHRDPLTAALPLLLVASALAALLIVAISRSIFGLSTWAATGVACVAISAPFYRFIWMRYSLPTLIAMPVLLQLIWATVLSRSQRGFDAPLAIGFGAAYTLLWFLDPMMCAIGVVAQLVTLALCVLMDRASWQAALRTLAAIAVPLVLLAVAFSERIQVSVRSVTAFFQQDASGDRLGLVSPLAIFGWPGTATNRVQYEDPTRQAWAIAAFCAIALMLSLSDLLSSYRRQTTVPQRTLTGLVSVALVAYCTIFALFGASSLQWRFASMVVLPFAFIPIAAAWHLLQILVVARSPTHPEDGRLYGAVAGYAAMALVLGNVAVHGFKDPPRAAMSAKWIALEAVRQQPIEAVTLKLEERASTTAAFAHYLLVGKEVEVIDSTVRLDDVPLEMISRRHGLFLQNFSCQGVGHDETLSVTGLGCLLLAPPSLSIGTAYPFSSTFLFIGRDGMTAREPGGRWNTRPTLELKVTGDPGRVGLDRDLHMNIFLNPYLPPNVKPQQLIFRWRNGELGETFVEAQEWISLPVRRADWVGSRLWTLSVEVEFPEGRTMLFHELSLTAVPRGRSVDRRRVPGIRLHAVPRAGRVRGG